MKDSEKRLLIAFAVLAFLFVNGYAYVQITERHKTVKEDRVRLEGEISRAKILERALPEVQLKDEWLRANMVVPKSEDQLLTYLVESVEAEAANHGLADASVTPRPRQDTEVAVVTVVDAKVKGNMMQIRDLVYALQRPAKFRSITQFKLTPNRKDPTSVTVEMRVEQWWAPDSIERLEQMAAAPADGVEAGPQVARTRRAT